MPALDGLRGAAICAVLLYHGGVSWARGGYLGVDAFFVLSGFLITTLLYAEWRARGRIALGAFWARRARRLLPALFLVLAAVALYGATVAPDDLLRRLRGDAFGALGYVANWRLVASGQSYFDQFATPSPLRHVWSLAIEEQFYFVWPLLFVAILHVTRGARRALVPITLALAVASGALMVLLFESGADVSRVYYGSDTRAQSLLVGAVLALLLADRAESPTGLTPVLHAASIPAAAVLIWMWADVSDSTTWLYRGGLAGSAVLVAVVIADVSSTAPGPLGAALSTRPMRWVGLISYGLYLWHWPVYVFLSPDRTGLDGWPLLVLRLGLAFGVATASYHLVETPIRRGALRRWPIRVLTPAAGGAVALAFVLVTAGVAADPLGEAASARAGSAPGLARPVTRAQPSTVRALLVGDSVALTLGEGFEAVRSPRLAVQNGAALGCGLLRGDMLSAGQWYTPNPDCNTYLDRVVEHVVSERPEIVVALWGAWDLSDRRVDGDVQRWATPALDQHIVAALESSVTRLTQTGARLLLLTSPYYQPPDLASRPDRFGTAFETARVDHWNNLVKTVSRAYPESVTLVDLHAFLTPVGQAAGSVPGVDNLRSDGIHFSPEGAAVVARWLAPKIRHAAEPTSSLETPTDVHGRQDPTR